MKQKKSTGSKIKRSQGTLMRTQRRSSPVQFDSQASMTAPALPLVSRIAPPRTVLKLNSLTWENQSPKMTTRKLMDWARKRVIATRISRLFKGRGAALHWSTWGTTMGLPRLPANGALGRPVACSPARPRSKSSLAPQTNRLAATVA